MSIGTPSARLLFLPGLTFALTWTFFPAIQLELDNNLLFPIAFGQAVFVFLALALALACLLVVIFSACNDRCREIAALALMGFAAVGWIKGHIFEWDHTLFDGKSVDWNVHRFEDVADFALYTLVALLAVVWRKRLILNRNAFCAFICLAQLSNLVLISPLFSAESVGELLAKQTVGTKEKTAEIVSRNKNLIVIMLDTFQSDVFAELVATHPEIASGLTGFTYFNDAASVYPYTEVSIPGVLTGVEYENRAPYNHYLYQSYRAPTSILATLVENGYYVEVDRWGIATPIPYLSTLASNFTAYRLPPLSTIRDMALVALYSELPRFGKRLVYQRVSEMLIDVQGTLDNNMNFIRNLSKLGVETIDEPVAKVIHLKGPHVPLRRYDRYGFDYFAAASDLNATFSEAATSRENYKAVAMQALLSVAAYLEKLKLAHAYDNATIFVFGDHGAGLQGQQFVLPAGWPVKSPAESITGQLPTSAIPLLLVKRAAAAGTMATSATAASLEDINCTVFRELGIARPGTCVSLFDSGIASRGARRFLWPRVATFSRGYLPTLREFKIKGPVWEESSWTTSGRGFAPGNNIRIPATAYEIGQTIRFGTKGNATEYQSYGWGDPGDGFTWTIGKRATMTLPLASTHPGPLSLEATLIPFVVEGKLDRQLIGVYVNGVKLNEWSATKFGRYTTTIPGELIEGGRIELRFDLPDATSVARLGIGDDQAIFAFQMISVALNKASTPRAE